MRHFLGTVALTVLSIGAAQFMALQLNGCEELTGGARVALSFLVTLTVLALRGGHKETT